MLSHEEALVHARQHLYSRRPPIEHVWVLEPGKRVTGGWFFYYGLEPLRLIRTRGFPQFAGPPGFMVSDDGNVRGVGWDEFPKLVPREPEKEVMVPDMVSVTRLTELAGINIYTLALMIRELSLGEETSEHINFANAAKVLSFCGIVAKRQSE